MYPNRLGCIRIGRVRIIDNQHETLAPVGTPTHASGGEIRGSQPGEWIHSILLAVALASLATAPTMPLLDAYAPWDALPDVPTP